MNSPAPTFRETVSSESELLLLVDENDQVVGHASKGSCHDGDGVLHRAFSLFVFNAQGELLLQQRSFDKRLWGGFWSNSCCSHPRVGEQMDEAVERRLREELGIGADLSFLYKFQYQADFGDLGAENELCWVFVGRSDDPVCVNESEIAAWRFISVAELEREMDAAPETFTPWFKMEWSRLRSEFSDHIERLTEPVGQQT